MSCVSFLERFTGTSVDVSSLHELSIVVLVGAGAYAVPEDTSSGPQDPVRRLAPGLVAHTPDERERRTTRGRHFEVVDVVADECLPALVRGVAVELADCG